MTPTTSVPRSIPAWSRTAGPPQRRPTAAPGDVPPYTLRVTQIYRREDGDWKVVHRHGDHLPFNQTQNLPGEASTQ